MVGRWPEFSYDFPGACSASLWPVGKRKGRDFSTLMLQVLFAICGRSHYLCVRAAPSLRGLILNFKCLHTPVHSDTSDCVSQGSAQKAGTDIGFLWPAVMSHPELPALKRLRQEDYKFEASLGYRVKPCFSL